MAMQSEMLGQVGPQVLADGVIATARQGKTGELIVQELHGRFFEQTYRGNFYRIGTTTIVAGASTMGTATGLSATLATAATGVPMLGIWNPLTSAVYAVLTQAAIQAYANTVTTPASFGGLVWCVSPGNSAISTGLVPFNSKTLAQQGSAVKGFAGATALTGLSIVPTAIENSDFQSGGQSIAYGTIGNTAIVPTMVQVQNFDGQLFVPPGCVLALYNTSASTSFSFTGRLLWEEVPV